MHFSQQSPPPALCRGTDVTNHIYSGNKHVLGKVVLKRPYGYSGLSCTKSSASLSVIGKAYAAGVVENTGILPTAHVFLLGHVIHHC